MQKIPETNSVLNVLCLEDTLKDAELLQEMLVDAGYRVNMNVAAQEKKYISFLKSGNYHIILADYTLPGFNGFTALKLALELQPEVPFICVSGTIGEDTAVELLKQGATDYVLKDRLGRLAFTVKRALEGVEQRKERNKAVIEKLELVHSLEVHQVQLKSQNEELILANEQLEIAAKKYTKLYDFAPIGYFTLTRDGAIQQVNLTGVTLLNAERGKLLKRRFRLLVSPASRPILNAFLEKVFAAGGEKQTCEVELLRGKTESFWAQIEAVSDEARVTCRAVLVDISARKRAEQALQEGEERYHDFISQSFEGIYCTKFDHPIDITLPVETQIDLIYENAYMAECNQALADMYNLPSVNDLIGVRLIDAHGGKDNPANRAAFRKLIENGYRSSNDETFEYTAAGKPIWFLSNTVGIFENGHLVRLWGESIDITERKLAEIALDESQAQLAGIIDSAMDAIVTIDEDQKITIFNAAAQRMFGYSAAELMGQPLDRLLPEHYRPIHKSHIERFRKTGVTSRAMGSLQALSGVRANGEEFPIDASISQIEIRGRKMLTVILRDITARKQVEDNLLKSEERYRTLFDQASDGIFIANRDGQYVDVNSAACRLLGYTREEILQLSMRDVTVLSPETPIRFEELNRGDTIISERKMIRKDKTLVSVEISAKKLPDGRLQGIVRDITERKQAEMELGESEERLKLATRAGNIGVWDWDIANDKLVWDDSMYLLYDIRKEDFGNVYDAWLKTLHPDDRDYTDVEVQAALRGEREYAPEFRIIRRDGEIRVMKSASQTLYDENRKARRMIGVNIDITERKQAEAALLESRNIYRLMMESLPDSSIHLVDHNLRYQIIGGGELEKNNSDKSLILGKTLYEAFPQDIIDTYEPLLKRALAGESTDVELPYGSFIYHQQILPVRDGAGNIFGALNISTNITERKQAEEARRQLSEIVERSLNEIYVFDSETLKFRHVNQGALKNLEYTLEQIRTMTPLDIKPEFTEESFRATIQPLLARERELLIFETVHRRANGSLYPVEIHLQLVEDQNEHVFLAVISDITERKQAEEALRENEATLRAFFDNAPMMMGITELEGDDIRHLADNAAVERFFNFAPGATRNRLASDIGAPSASIDMWVRHYRASQQGGPARFEYPHVTPDDSRWLSVTVAPIALEAAQARFCYVVDDITERKQAEEAVVKYAAQLATVARISVVVSALLDMDKLLIKVVNLTKEEFNLYHTHIYLLNDSGDALMLTAGAGEIGLQMVANSHSIPLDRQPSVVARAAREKQIVSINDITQTQDFLPNLLLPDTRSELAVPLIVGGKMLGVFDIQSDEVNHFTEADINVQTILAGKIAVAIQNAHEFAARKQAEEALQQLNATLEVRVSDRTAQLQAANKELEAFSYSVSHDLRAPLRGIDGFSQALTRKYADAVGADGQHYLTRIQENTRTMGQLIDDLLSLARITRREMKQDDVNLSKLAREVADGLQLQDPERRIQFEIEEQVEARGDAGLLKIVLQNLMGNAFKFTSTRAEAKIQFGLAQSSNSLSTTETVYYVKDNGVGFDMAYANKLFGAFQRLHAADEFPGSGIGLATSQRIVHRHGGRIWAEAEVDKGAAFYFTLG